jgi:hypothetical protein
VIRGMIEPREAGPLFHHGPELLPFVDLIVGGGLPVVAAFYFGKVRSVRARLVGGSPVAGDAVVDGDERTPATPVTQDVPLDPDRRD